MHTNLYNITKHQLLHISGLTVSWSGSKQLYKPRSKASLPLQEFAAVFTKLAETFSNWCFV